MMMMIIIVAAIVNDLGTCYSKMYCNNTNTNDSNINTTIYIYIHVYIHIHMYILEISPLTFLAPPGKFTNLPITARVYYSLDAGS